MFLNISTPIKRNVKFTNKNNQVVSIKTTLSNYDIKKYFNAKKIIT
jgi:hypothetical protein